MLREPLLLGSEDSGLTIEAANANDSEVAEISGAASLGPLAWKPYKVTGGANIYVAKVADTGAARGMTGLRVDGKRAIRARWPNGDPEYQLFPAGWVSTNGSDWLPPRAHAGIRATEIRVTTPNRSDESPCGTPTTSANGTGFCNYVTGVGGACAALGFDPPAGYWCIAHPPRGVNYSVAFPSGLRYAAGAFDGRRWPSFEPNRSILNAFRTGHWFTYAFLIDKYDPANRTLGWTYGGFQGGEGNQKAEEWNVENVFEELDAPNEWFFDEASSNLYYFHNGTGAPPPSLTFAATGPLTELVIVKGGGTAAGETAPPVRDLTFRGITFSGAGLSYLEPHGLPSDGGGDWALARRGAVRIEGAERVAIDGCTFRRVDGNAVVIQGYARNVTVRGSEFHLIGENGIVSWGFTADFPNASRAVPIPKTMGPDATDGNHPQGNLIEGNVFHEIGHFQKQVRERPLREPLLAPPSRVGSPVCRAAPSEHARARSRPPPASPPRLTPLRG